MKHFHIQTRRDFLSTAMKTGALAALSSLTDIPLVMKQALAAQPGLGTNGKKLLFIFLRGANDGLNSVVPIEDDGYAPSRPTLAITKDPGVNYTAAGPCDLSATSDANTPTFYNAATGLGYRYGISLGNGFAALHPSLKFLAPVYNSGDLALIHRVAYPRQSRSHFDSQNYWETGNPNNNLSKDGIFYRTIIESGIANTAALTGVSIQSSLPLILRGSQAAMTNLDDPTRYDLRGIPEDVAGNAKAINALRAANLFQYPDKMNRDFLALQYKNLSDTLDIFATLPIQEAQNTWVDADTTSETSGYHLFPSTNAKNALGNVNKYVVSTGSYTFFTRLKNAALVLNHTDAIIAGTQLDGFDTHSGQGNLNGSHPNLQRSIAWAIYGLKKYFTQHANKTTWDNLVVITLSEFGRTTVENSDAGTDHAEAGVMFVAGGAVKGYEPGRSGVFGCSPADTVPWVEGTSAGVSSMYGASSRYLKRAYDYRSVLGKLIRDHMGATQSQLDRIIPAYVHTPTLIENLRLGGVSSVDNVRIMGEPDII